MDEQKKSVIQRWLVKASHDLITAKVMLKNDPSVTDTICFHAHQCVEKALKAFLVFAVTESNLTFKQKAMLTPKEEAKKNWNAKGMLQARI